MKESVRFNYLRFMKKITLIILFFAFGINVNAQEVNAKEFQERLNIEFGNKNFSPLSDDDRMAFKALPFFKISNKYKIKATFVKAENPERIRLKTTTERLPSYLIYGTVEFKFKGQLYKLNVYQSTDAAESDDRKNDLFIPFTDASNGTDTYGGGRYLDLKVPSGSKIILDFNKAYNPYCAYSKKFSCPIVPEENDIPFRIEAGILYVDKHVH